MGRVVLQRVALESRTHNFATIESILREGLVVNLGALPTDPRGQKVLVVLWRAAIIAKVGDLAGAFVGASDYLLC